MAKLQGTDVLVIVRRSTPKLPCHVYDPEAQDPFDTSSFPFEAKTNHRPSLSGHLWNLQGRSINRRHPVNLFRRGFQQCNTSTSFSDRGTIPSRYCTSFTSVAMYFFGQSTSSAAAPVNQYPYGGMAPQANMVCNITHCLLTQKQCFRTFRPNMHSNPAWGYVGN
jgi:hypothetical protein